MIIINFNKLKINMRNELKILGLSDKEIEVYIAGLKLGPTTINKLSQSAQIKRSTVYVVLERLKQRGLVNQGLKRARKIFEMADPDKFLKLIEEEKEKIKEKEESAQKAVMSLKALASKAELATDVKMFEGYDASMRVLVDLGKTKNPIYCVYSGYYLDQNNREKFKKTVAEFNRARMESGGKNYVITDPESLTSKFYPTVDSDVREYRFFKKEEKLPAMVDISEDKVIFSTVRDKFSSVVIQNKTIAETLKFMFDVMWEGLEEKNSSKI